jgi:hypothetical protein
MKINKQINGQQKNEIEKKQKTFEVLSNEFQAGRHASKRASSIHSFDF